MRYDDRAYAEEVHVSKKGNDYIPAKELLRKKTVYSEAVLIKVKHTHETTLKIGRYKIDSNMPESSKPKSELTLSEVELNALIAYLNENYTELKLI